MSGSSATARKLQRQPSSDRVMWPLGVSEKTPFTTINKHVLVKNMFWLKINFVSDNLGNVWAPLVAGLPPRKTFPVHPRWPCHVCFGVLLYYIKRIVLSNLLVWNESSSFSCLTTAAGGRWAWCIERWRQAFFFLLQDQFKGVSGLNVT